MPTLGGWNGGDGGSRTRIARLKRPLRNAANGIHPPDIGPDRPGRTVIARLSAACSQPLSYARRTGGLVRFRSTPRNGAGFTDRLPEPPAFPTPNCPNPKLAQPLHWCPDLVLTQDLPLTKQVPCHWTIGAIGGKPSTRNSSPRGSHSLAGRPGNLAGRLSRIGGRRTCRSPARLAPHPLRTEPGGRTGSPSFDLAERRACRSACLGRHRSGSGRGRAPARLTLHYGGVAGIRRPIALPRTLRFPSGDGEPCRLLTPKLVRAVRVELTLDRLSTCCLCHWATCAIWFRAQVSNLDLSAFKAQRPRRQLARIENGCPRRFRTSCFPRSERGGRTNQLRGIDTGAGHRI